MFTKLDCPLIVSDRTRNSEEELIITSEQCLIKDKDKDVYYQQNLGQALSELKQKAVL